MVSTTCLFLVCLGAFLTTANALSCYTCDSTKEAKCSYPITSFLYNKEECSSNLGFLAPSQCYKVTGKNKEGNQFVLRGCMAMSAGSSVCNAIVSSLGSLSGLSGDNEAINSMNCYTCDTDNCNSATKTGAVGIVALLVASMAFLF